MGTYILIDLLWTGGSVAPSQPISLRWNWGIFAQICSACLEGPYRKDSSSAHYDTSGVSTFKYNQCTLVKVKRKIWESNSKRKGQIKDKLWQKKWKEKEKGWKATQKLIQKCAQNFSWLMGGASIDMCSIEHQPKTSQKLNKTKVLLCKFANVPIVQNVGFKWKFA